MNDSRDDEHDERRRILEQLIPGAATDLWLQPPFYCDYGWNITNGANVFLNFNCVMFAAVNPRSGGPAGGTVDA